MSQYPQVKCATCGWVHIAIPADDAREQVDSVNAWCASMGKPPGASVNDYRRCFRCGADSATFFPAVDGDAPTLSTLMAVVTER